MGKKNLAWAVSAIVLAFSAAAILAAENEQTPQKPSLMGKIKKTYSDFKNRNQENAAAMPAAAQASKIKPKKMPAGKTREDMTKEEILADIKDDLKNGEEIFNTLQGLKAEKDSGDKIFYTFNDVKLEDMTREELASLAGKIGQIAVRFRTERIQSQLNIAKRAGIAGPPAAVVVPGQGGAALVPRIVQPSQQPLRNTTPPLVSRPPSAPPAPPSARR